ncbi:MAG TPA: hypothetical protein DDZ88_20310 [Verrucomicrobiales bacterium]|nr:hypothetical protein [Verrucomicrobiales bacterium]
MKRKEDPTEIIRHLKHGSHGLLLVCQQEGKVWLARSGSDPMGWRKPANQTVPWSPARPPIDALLCRAADFESQAKENAKSLKRSMTKAQRTWRTRLASYAADIAARRIYVYAIRHQQFGRATLAIQLYGASSWEVRQLAGAKNQMPEIELSRVVEKWLRSSQPPSKPRAFSESVMAMEEVPF